MMGGNKVYNKMIIKKNALGCYVSLHSCYKFYLNRLFVLILVRFIFHPHKLIQLFDFLIAVIGGN